MRTGPYIVSSKRTVVIAPVAMIPSNPIIRSRRLTRLRNVHQTKANNEHATGPNATTIHSQDGPSAINSVRRDERIPMIIRSRAGQRRRFLSLIGFSFWQYLLLISHSFDSTNDSLCKKNMEFSIPNKRFPQLSESRCLIPKSTSPLSENRRLN